MHISTAYKKTKTSGRERLVQSINPCVWSADSVVPPARVKITCAALPPVVWVGAGGIGSEPENCSYFGGKQFPQIGRRESTTTITRCILMLLWKVSNCLKCRVIEQVSEEKKNTYRRIAYGVIDVGANLHHRLGAGIVRKAPCVVETGRRIRLSRTHFHTRVIYPLSVNYYKTHFELLHNMLSLGLHFLSYTIGLSFNGVTST